MKKLPVIIILALLAMSVSTLATLKPPFTPKGDKNIVGRWGRNCNLITANGNEMAKKIYTEHKFLANGKYTCDGYEDGEKVHELGVYRFDGRFLEMFVTKLTLNGKRHEEREGAYVKVEVTQAYGRQTFLITLSMYQKGVWWDFNSNSYRDSDGDQLGAPGAKATSISNVRRTPIKDPVYGLFPVDVGEFEIVSIDFRGKITGLWIYLQHQIPNDQKNFFNQETALIKKSALKWLKKHKVSLKGVKITYVHR